MKFLFSVLSSVLLLLHLDTAAGECKNYVGAVANVKRQHKASHGHDAAFPPSDTTLYREHKPVVAINEEGGYLTVSVGELNTPHLKGNVLDNTPVHFVTAIYVTDYDTGDVIDLALFAGTSEEVLTTDLRYASSQPLPTRIEAFVFCNIHGLFSSGPIDMPADFSYSQGDNYADAECRIDTCQPVMSDDSFQRGGPCTQFLALEKEMQRRQEAEHSASEPFTATGEHMINVQMAYHMRAVMVSTSHKNTDSADPDQVHFIEFMYLKDQDGNILSMDSYVPYSRSSETDTSFDTSMEVSVSDSVLSVTPYLFCNTHGWFKGAVYELPPRDWSQQDRYIPSVCGTGMCGGYSRSRHIHNPAIVTTEFQVEGSLSDILEIDFVNTVAYVLDGLYSSCRTICSSNLGVCWIVLTAIPRTVADLMSINKDAQVHPSADADRYTITVTSSPNSDVSNSLTALTTRMEEVLHGVFLTTAGAEFIAGSVSLTYAIPDTDDDDGITPAVIGGIAGGGAALLIIIIILIKCCCCDRCCTRTNEEHDENDPDTKEEGDEKSPDTKEEDDENSPDKL